MLWTNEMEETISFYTEILGFNCQNYDKQAGWAILVKDEAEIMLSLPNSHAEFSKPNFTGSFYINTENVEELWEKLKGKCKICYPMDDFDYGMREFGIYDNNGYLLQFGKDLKATS